MNLAEVNLFVTKNAGKTGSKFRPKFHAVPPLGWMNDPNGFIKIGKKYHLFFQFHPFKADWGTMYWGHMTSEDLVKWEYLDVALAPDQCYDKDGCWSGCSVYHNGIFYLIYTSVADGFQTISIAESLNGNNFTKFEGNPIIDKTRLPPDSIETEFRDPKIIRRGDAFYMAAAGKSSDGEAQILLYKSNDLYHWKFVSKPVCDKRMPGLYECPDIFSLEGKDIILTSPQKLPQQADKHENIDGNLYFTGQMDYDSGVYIKESEDEIDGGFDFYAAQTLQEGDRRIMIAWMQMWGRTFPTAEEGWIGAMTLPRQLSILDGALVQTPVKEIERYRKKSFKISDYRFKGTAAFDGVEGNTVEIKICMDISGTDVAGVRFLKKDGFYGEIYYDKINEEIVFDRSRCGIDIKGMEEDAVKRRTKLKLKTQFIELRMFLDVYLTEVFVCGGRNTFSGNVYSGGEEIEFFASGEVGLTLDFYKLEI